MEGDGSDPSSLIDLSILSTSGNNTHLPPFSITWNSFPPPPSKQSTQANQSGKLVESIQLMQPPSYLSQSQSQDASSLLSEISRLSQPSGPSTIMKEPDRFDQPVYPPSSQLPLSQFPTISSSQKHVVSSSQYVFSQTSKIAFPIPSIHSNHRDDSLSKPVETRGFSQNPSPLPSLRNCPLFPMQQLRWEPACRP